MVRSNWIFNAIIMFVCLVTVYALAETMKLTGIYVAQLIGLYQPCKGNRVCVGGNIMPGIFQFGDNDIRRMAGGKLPGTIEKVDRTSDGTKLAVQTRMYVALRNGAMGYEYRASWISGDKIVYSVARPSSDICYYDDNYQPVAWTESFNHGIQFPAEYVADYAISNDFAIDHSGKYFTQKDTSGNINIYATEAPLSVMATIGAEKYQYATDIFSDRNDVVVFVDFSEGSIAKIAAYIYSEIGNTLELRNKYILPRKLYVSDMDVKSRKVLLASDYDFRTFMESWYLLDITTGKLEWAGFKGDSTYGIFLNEELFSLN